MGRQYFVESIWHATESGTAVANTTTETTLFPVITIPANFLRDGRLLRVTAIGQYSTTGTPTMLFSIRLGGAAGTLVCKSAACTTPSGVTAAVWKVEALLQVRTNGSSGTVMGNGIATVCAAVAGTVASATGEGLVTPMTQGGVVTPATATVDFTANQDLVVTITWGTASASNTITGLNLLVEAVN